MLRIKDNVLRKKKQGRLIRFFKAILSAVERAVYPILALYTMLRNGSRIPPLPRCRTVKKIRSILLILFFMIFVWFIFQYHDSDNYPLVPPESNPLPLNPDLLYPTMTHLERHPRSRYPAFQVLSPRKKSEIDVVIGIPTKKKMNEGHLADTIQALVHGLTREQRESTLIVVSVGEGFDLSYVADTAYTLNIMFPLDFGLLIEVISPTQYWYPEKTTSVQPQDENKTAKRNLDIIFLMTYVQDKGSFFLLLSDDVDTEYGYMTEILNFSNEQIMPDWLSIKYSTNNVGILFQMNHLEDFSKYIQTLYRYLQFEILYELHTIEKVCGMDTSSSAIEEMSMLDSREAIKMARVWIYKKRNGVCYDLLEMSRPTYDENLFEYLPPISSARKQDMKDIAVALKKDPKYLFFKHKIFMKLSDN